jgi:HK97 family phage portal protein
MGVLDWLFGSDNPQPGEVARQLAPPYPSVEAAIAAVVAARGLTGPMELPAVERGVELLASTVAQLQPVAYRDGSPLSVELAPRIVTRPDPWSTRYAFLHATVRSMVETGDAFWFLFDPDPETRRPRGARVLDPAEVSVEWDARRFLPVYTWRGRTMTPGVDLAHVPLAPRAGQLRGVSPLQACSHALLAITAAELYASGYYGGAGVPSGVLTSPVELTDDEADALRAAWLAHHSSGTPTPAVLSGGIAYDKVADDPEASQLVETREHGVATVARLLGIPAPLLLVSIGGSSITYANVSQLYVELVRTTVAPLYLAPIEAAMSDLVPRTSSVRFDLGELGRLDVAGRFAVYQAAAALGVLDGPAIARLEGIRPPDQVPTPYSPTPTPLEAPAAPEVPVA